MAKKIFLILVILGGYLFCWPEITLAQDGGVNMRARVLERKMTDTINDFVWDGQAPISTSTPLSPPPKAVLGASSVRSNLGESSNTTQPIHKTTKAPNKYLLFLPPVYAVYYVIINSY